jgi:hypothetical protein
MLQMLFYDFINIRCVRIGVPDAIRVNRDNRPLLATIHAARAINTAFTRPFKSQFFDLVFSVFAQTVGIMIGATGGAVVASIGTEKNMMLEIAHGNPACKKIFTNYKPLQAKFVIKAPSNPIGGIYQALFRVAQNPHSPSKTSRLTAFLTE